MNHAATFERINVGDPYNSIGLYEAPQDALNDVRSAVTQGTAMNEKANVEQVRVEDLHKSYGDNEVLKGVSLSASSGDVISIIGSSGSGKSTWLRCINFLENPTSGRVVVGGKEVGLKRNRKGDLVVADPKQLQLIRTRLSMVFQHFNLWSHMTVLENVIEAPIHVLGLPKAEVLERAERYL